MNKEELELLTDIKNELKSIRSDTRGLWLIIFIWFFITMIGIFISFFYTTSL
jgi:hypothetical protein